MKENFHTAHKLDKQLPKEFLLCTTMCITLKKSYGTTICYIFSLYSITVIYLSSEVPSFIHVSLHAHTKPTPSQTASYFLFSCINLNSFYIQFHRHHLKLYIVSLKKITSDSLLGIEARTAQHSSSEVGVVGGKMINYCF